MGKHPEFGEFTLYNQYTIMSETSKMIKDSGRVSKKRYKRTLTHGYRVTVLVFESEITASEFHIGVHCLLKNLY